MDEFLAIDLVVQLIHLKEASFISDTIIEVVVEAGCPGPEEQKGSRTTHKPGQVLECFSRGPSSIIVQNVVTSVQACLLNENLIRLLHSGLFAGAV
jgi:hypothetical protein